MQSFECLGLLKFTWTWSDGVGNTVMRYNYKINSKTIPYLGTYRYVTVNIPRGPIVLKGSKLRYADPNNGLPRLPRYLFEHPTFRIPPRMYLVNSPADDVRVLVPCTFLVRIRV